MTTATYKLKDFMGCIMMLDVPPRQEGSDLILRTRVVVYKGDGAVESDKTYDGVRVIGGAECPWYFYEPTK